MVRSLSAVALVVGLAGCVVEGPPAYYGYYSNYGYAPAYYAPGYYAPTYYAPGYYTYAQPSIGIGVGFGGHRGGGHHGWRGR